MNYFIKKLLISLFALILTPTAAYAHIATGSVYERNNKGNKQYFIVLGDQHIPGPANDTQRRSLARNIKNFHQEAHTFTAKNKDLGIRCIVEDRNTFKGFGMPNPEDILLHYITNVLRAEGLKNITNADNRNPSVVGYFLKQCIATKENYIIPPGCKLPVQNSFVASYDLKPLIEDNLKIIKETEEMVDPKVYGEWLELSRKENEELIAMAAELEARGTEDFNPQFYRQKALAKGCPVENLFHGSNRNIIDARFCHLTETSTESTIIILAGVAHTMAVERILEFRGYKKIHAERLYNNISELFSPIDLDRFFAATMKKINPPYKALSIPIVDISTAGFAFGCYLSSLLMIIGCCLSSLFMRNG